MKVSIQTKLDNLAERFEELTALLGDSDIISDQDKFRNYSKEYAQLEPIVKEYSAYKDLLDDIEQATLMVDDNDEAISALAREELEESQSKLEQYELALQKLLLPRDPDDSKNVFLEIRAGTGGDEAAIFAGDLFRMYGRYAEVMGWQIEVVNQSEGEHGGFKELIARIAGQNVYSHLKFESGAHRVQRVPATESQGRIHTSACTVAILPELDEVDEIDVNTSDIRTDTYRASGAGGQHVNKTDSAIRLTHIPTGIVVECQDERSQHKNRARAMSLLKAKLLEEERSKQREERASERKSLVGSGDRSERIRTYNYPQGRITDHRINLTLYKLTEIMEGGLQEVIEPLVHESQAEQLAALSGEE